MSDGGPDERVAWLRTGIFVAVMTAANLIIGSQLSYRGVEQMDTGQFCGQSCHVMKPEFTAPQLAPHRVAGCVDCHVAPGASGWVQSNPAPRSHSRYCSERPILFDDIGESVTAG